MLTESGPSLTDTHQQEDDKFTTDLLKAYVRSLPEIQVMKSDEEQDAFAGLDASTQQLNALEALLKNGLSDSEKVEIETEYPEAFKSKMEIRNRIVETNLPLVIWIAKKLAGRGVATVDLIQEGNLHLVEKATENFDSEKGYKFSTYATKCVKNAMKRAILRDSRTIHVPEYVILSSDSLFEAQIALHEILGHEPTMTELSEAVAMPVDKIRLTFTSLKNPVSLNEAMDEMSDDEGEDWIDTKINRQEEDFTEVVEDNIIATDRFNRLLKYMNDINMKPAEVCIILLSSGYFTDNPMTFRDIGRKFGLRHQSVQQRMKFALEKISENMAQHDALTSEDVASFDSKEYIDWVVEETRKAYFQK